MSHSLLNHHCLRLQRASYPEVSALLRRGLLVPTDEPLHRSTGLTWQVHPTCHIEAVSDVHLRVGDTVVQTDLYRLPTPAYRALIEDSPRFVQYPGLDWIFGLAHAPQVPAAALAGLLETIVAAGRVPDVVPRLVVTPTTFFSTWQPHTTSLRQAARGDWFVHLGFETCYLPGQQAADPVAIGLDLGIRPLTTAVTSTGVVSAFWGNHWAHSADQSLDLSPDATALYRQIQYASGRRSAEQIISYVVHHGSAVFAEALNHRGMRGYFVHVGRDRAIHDYHYSWLPHYLQLAQIPLVRVNPAHTSTICSACGAPGERQGHTFRCPVCQTQHDSHVNAARNILQRGLGLAN